MKTQKKIVESYKTQQGQEIEIELYYHKGGMNYFTSDISKRGIYLQVTPVTITRHDGYSMKETRCFSGIKQCVKEMNRFSQKIFDQYTPDKETIDNLLNHVLSKNNLTLIEHKERITT